MQLEAKKKSNILAYLNAYTPYPFSYLSSLYDQQLYVIFKRTEQLRYKLILEILTLQKEISGERIYTKEKLEKLDTATLSSIQNDFSNGQETLKLDLSPSQEIFTDSTPDEEYEYLEPEEIEEMYGEESCRYSDSELRNKGIYLASFAHSMKQENANDLKELLITFLLRAHQKGLIYFPFNRVTLQTYSLEVLKDFYTSKMKNLTDTEEYPPLEELIASLKLHNF